MDRDLTVREFLGVVLKDEDPKIMGRYRVHIPELMPHLTQDKGIYCKNNVGVYRIGKSGSGFYGSYVPLQPGTKVVVRFYENDLNSGYIDRVVSDEKEKTVYNPASFLEDGDKKGKAKNPEETRDRDDVYLILKTPKHNNAVYFVEDTRDHKPNEFWFSFNSCRTALRVNEDGITITTRDSERVRINIDNVIHVVKNKKEKVGEDFVREVGSDYDLKVAGDITIEAGGNVHITAHGKMCLHSDDSITIHGAGGVTICPPPVFGPQCPCPKPAAEAEDVELLSQKDAMSEKS